MIYVDTSAIVAALDPKDPRRTKAIRMLESYKDKVVSELVIAELASVLARHGRVLANIREELGVDGSVAFMSVLLYILRRFDLRYIRVKDFASTLLGEFYEPMGYAVEFAEKLKLKTLDVLHLAYIKAMIEQGLPIYTILTADKEFKDKEESIRKTIRIATDLIT